MSEITLTTKIHQDEYTEFACKLYDVAPSQESITQIHNNIVLPMDDWHIGLIYGQSGSGKTTLLKTFGHVKEFAWSDRSIISELRTVNPEKAALTLSAVGLSSVPSWLRPFRYLSTGEQFRANLARELVDGDDLILLDEFTSVVDRNVAKAASFALQKFLRRENKRAIIASCHSDIIEWLNPDWVYNPLEGVTHYPRGRLQRPQISLKIFRSKYEAWELFKQHHYLTHDLNKAAKLFLATWNDNPVACVAIIAMPNPYLKNAWRISRTVVLPDYQGMGIGVRLTDYFGSLVKARGGRLYSRTVHPAIIAHRLQDTKWKQTQHSKEKRRGGMRYNGWFVDNQRVAHAFEYIGEAASHEDSKIFWETT